MKSTCLYPKAFRKTILLVLVVLLVSCDSESKKEDDPVIEPVFMQWTADVELNTKILNNGRQRHYIFFPLTDCSYEIKCTNFSELEFVEMRMIGAPDMSQCPHPGDGTPEWPWMTDPENTGSLSEGKVSSPYYNFEIKGNTLYVYLKGGSTDRKPCELTFGLKADDDHCDEFEFIPENIRILEVGQNVLPLTD